VQLKSIKTTIIDQGENASAGIHSRVVRNEIECIA